MMEDITNLVPTVTFEGDKVFRTYKGVKIDITPTPVPPEVDAILEKVGFGELEIDQVLNRPANDDEVAASRIIQRMYDAKCEGGRFHLDDDFEEILSAVCEDLQKDHA
jgi:hypothetical protein